MVQIRVMTDDRERGERVVEILLPLLQACTALQAGEPTRLTHRGGGLRLVLDVQPDEGPTSVRVDRADVPARPERTARRRRALPPGSR
ncbi:MULTISPECIES: hypothetical protein [Streptomyces]|jgi:hypothetical protein|uniref:hypothetical protein n=2 Tax=Streptomyces TaxID=1883 RepID=UPI00075065F3|nr:MULTISPECIES: hypothetical protein [Streptomyces]MCF3177267.1 hypothetical protein [Streptomyces sioyaensis]